MKFSLFFCTAVFSLPALVIVSACSDTQDKPQTAVQAVAKAAQQAIPAPVAQPVVQADPAPVTVDCAAPLKAVDGVCLHPQLKRVNGRDDSCETNPKCIKIVQAWDKANGTKYPQFPL